MKLVHFPSEDKIAYFERLFLEANKKRKQIDTPAIALTPHLKATTSQATTSQLINHPRYGPAADGHRYRLRKSSPIKLTPD